MLIILLMMLTLFQSELLAKESDYKVVTSFEDAHLDYVSALIEYKFFKLKCKGNNVSKRRADWTCRNSKDGQRKMCYARFTCQETLFPGEKSEKNKELIGLINRYKSSRGSGKLRIKIRKIKEKTLIDKSQNKIESSEWSDGRDCKKGFCWASFQASGLRVSDQSGSALLTMNFSWTPKYTINKDWAFFVKAGGHFLSSPKVTSFLVFDTGLSAEYRFNKLALEVGVGRQIWNDTSGDVLGYMNLGTSYYFEEESLLIIDKIFLNYTSLSSERGISILSVGAGIEF